MGSQIDAKIDEKMYQKSSLILNGFFKEKGGKTEARGSPNGDQNERNSWKIRDLFSGTSQGRVWGGFSMDLGRILGGFWRDLGGSGSPTGDQNR